MSNVPDIICKRPCIHRGWFGKCIKPRDWKIIDSDAPIAGHYCVDRFPETCIYFEFDDTKMKRCKVRKFSKYLGYIGTTFSVYRRKQYKTKAVYKNCSRNRRKWWKIWRAK